MTTTAPDSLLRAARAVREGYRRFGYMRSDWAPPLGTRPPVTLAVCSIFRDEADYLPEWITFHRLQGVERFYLYDNLSSDDWQQRLEPELVAGIAEVRPWPQVPGQGSAYEDCLREHRTDTRWIAFIDVDEFLFSPTGEQLPDILQSFNCYPGVAVNWRVYGTNGWARSPSGLVLENYLYRGPDDHYTNLLIKSVVYPRQTLGVTDQPSHYFRLRGNPVGEDRVPVMAHKRQPATTDLLRINHYYAKSAEAFERKSGRPRADYGTITERFPPPPDMVRDETVLQFLPALKQALATRSSHSPTRRATGLGR